MHLPSSWLQGEWSLLSLCNVPNASSGLFLPLKITAEVLKVNSGNMFVCNCVWVWCHVVQTLLIIEFGGDGLRSDQEAVLGDPRGGGTHSNLVPYTDSEVEEGESLGLWCVYTCMCTCVCTCTAIIVCSSL